MIDNFWLSLGSAIGVSSTAFWTVAKWHEANRRAAAFPQLRNIETLTHEIAELRDRKIKLSDEVTAAQLLIHQRTNAEQWLEAHLQTYERAVRELPALQAQIELAREQHQSIIGQHNESIEELNKLRSQVRDLKETIGPAREELNRLEEARDWYEANRPEYQQLAAKVPELQAEVRDLEDQKTELRKERADLEVELSSLRSESDDLYTIN